MPLRAIAETAAGHVDRADLLDRRLAGCGR